MMAVSINPATDAESQLRSARVVLFMMLPSRPGPIDPHAMSGRMQNGADERVEGRRYDSMTLGVRFNDCWLRTSRRNRIVLKP